SDNKEGWIPLSDGLPGEPTTTALTSGSDNRMFLGTYDQGLYRSSWVLQIPDPQGKTDSYTLAVYPNPFRTLTTIEFQIPESQDVSIQIFNLTGHTISTLTDKIYSKGLHRLSWNAEELSPGLYYVRMQVGSYTGTKKLIITQ
ncbi:MAG: T9SS type A sorting domain-containing protein, partial [Bacteroidia bacterium]|nr:T9SS type A sorting domain-containing protein [Bacteroidia bacterium]